MPSTSAQLAANRQNALKSTGPRTADGKERSSRNAIKHGLCAAKAVLPGESAEEFAGFRDQLWSSLGPSNAMEEALVERIINCLWRLRRAGRINRDILSRVAQARRNKHFVQSRGSALPLANELGWAYEAASGVALDRVERHEIRLERSVLSTLQALHFLRASEVQIASDRPVQLDLFAAVDAEPISEERPASIDAEVSVMELARLPSVSGC